MTMSKEMLQAVTRTVTTLSLVGIVGVMAFTTKEEVQATVIGALIGSLGTALVFYFKKTEEDAK